MKMPFADNNEEDQSDLPPIFHGSGWEDMLESISSSTFAIIPAYMNHAIFGIDKDHHAIALVLWQGSPMAPLHGTPCPTYLMDERAASVMILRLQAILMELRALPFPPGSGAHDENGEDETHS